MARLHRRYHPQLFKARYVGAKDSTFFTKPGDVPFNDVHAFDVNVANVNALKITLTPITQKQEKPLLEDKSTTGVIFNVKAE